MVVTKHELPLQRNDDQLCGICHHLRSNMTTTFEIQVIDFPSMFSHHRMVKVGILCFLKAVTSTIVNMVLNTNKTVTI